MHPRAARLFAAIALANVLVACERGSSSARDPDDVVRWWPGDAPREERPGVVTDRSVLALAQAPGGAAGMERPAGADGHLTVHLESDGDLYLVGASLLLEGAQAGEVFDREWRRVREAHPDAFLLLRADRLRPWGEVRRVLERLGPEMSAVDFAVDVGAAEDGRIVAQAMPWSHGRDPAISLDVVDGAAGAAPRLRMGGATWTFAAGDPYARGPALDAANVAWTEIRDAMRHLSTPFSNRVVVAVDPRVPWAHVAQVLALAGVTGVRSVVVAGEGRPLWIGLSGRRRYFGSRPPIAPLSPPARDPRDVHPVLLVGMGVALAAIVVLLPLARRRYRRAPARVRPGLNETPPP